MAPTKNDFFARQRKEKAAISKAKKANQQWRKPNPKPTNPAPEGQCWIFNEERNEWQTRPKSNAGRVYDSADEVHDTPSPPLPLLKSTPSTSSSTPVSFPTSKIGRHPPPSVFCTKAKAENPSLAALTTAEITLHKVQGARVDKLKRTTFTEKVKVQGSRGPRYVTAQFQPSELFEAKKNEELGFNEKLRALREREETESNSST